MLLNCSDLPLTVEDAHMFQKIKAANSKVCIVGFIKTRKGEYYIIPGAKTKYSPNTEPLVPKELVGPMCLKYMPSSST